MNATNNNEDKVTNSQGESSAKSETIDPSFRETYESIEVMLQTKLSKYAALGALVRTEAKLSLSAILSFAVLSLVFMVVATSIWALVNLGLGLAIQTMVNSLWISVIALLVLNSLLGLFLINRLKYLWQLIGFTQTLKHVMGE